MIRTLKYGILPIAKDTAFVRDDVIDTVEMDNGNYYEVRRAFSGGLVAVAV